MLAVTAIVGHHVGFAACFAHFVFKDNHLAAARALDKDDVVVSVFKSFGRGQRHGRTHASCQNHSGPVVPNLRGMAERANDIENGVARFKAVEQRGGLADRLHHDGDGTGGRIGAFNGERNALASFVQAENKELSRPLLASNARRFNHNLANIETGRTG